MGFCLSCLREQPDNDESGERVPLTSQEFSEAMEAHASTRFNNSSSTSSGSSGGSSSSSSSSSNKNDPRMSKEQSEKRRAAYYQSIVDEANSRFLSSSSCRHYSGNDSTVDELRQQLFSVKIDPALLKSPPHRLLMKRTAASSQSAGSSSLQQQIVVDILSEPSNFSQFEAITDEVAELVRSHAFSCRIEGDEASSVVAKFKPVLASGSGDP